MGGRRDTSSRGSRQVPSCGLSRVVSSTLPLSSCSRFWSTCRRCVENNIGNHGVRNCVLIGARVSLSVSSGGVDEVAGVFRHTILEPVFQHQLGAFFRCFPPWRNGASRRFAAEITDLLVRLVEDGMLLFQRHLGRVFVRIAV